MTEAAAAGTTTIAEKRIHEEDTRGVAEWLDGLSSSNGPIRITLVRGRPKSWKGTNIEGTIDHFDEMISEEDIADQFGGGTYQVKVSVPNAKGGWKYLTSRTLKLPGDPKMNSVYTSDDDKPSSGNDAMAKQALEMQERATERAEERAAKAADAARESARSSGADVELIRATMQPLETMAKAASEEASELRSRLIEMSTARPDNTFQETMLTKMLDGESSRLEALRMQHESEMRAMRENHRQEIKDLRADSRRDLDRIDAAHQRELTAIQAANNMATMATSGAGDVRVESMKAIHDQLNRELTVTQTELTALRAKKEKPLTEQMGEIAQLKAIMGDLGVIPDGDAAGGEKWYERVLAAAGSSPVLARVLGAPPEVGEAQAQMQQQMQQMPPNVPFQAEDGNYYVRTEDGQMHQVDPKQLRRRKAAKARGEAGGGGELETEPEVRKPSAEEISAAISFMESAAKAGTDPLAFANTARSQIDQGLLLYLGKVGIDDFLNKVANLSQTSVLRQQSGRNWARKVAKILLEGTTE